MEPFILMYILHLSIFSSSYFILLCTYSTTCYIALECGPDNIIYYLCSDYLAGGVTQGG